MSHLPLVAQDPWGHTSTESWRTLREAVRAFGPAHSTRYEVPGATYRLVRGDTLVAVLTIGPGRGGLRGRLTWTARRRNPK